MLPSWESTEVTIIHIGFFATVLEDYADYVEFYSSCVDELLEKKATIDRITGLQIVAYYNFPDKKENHLSHACNAIKDLVLKSKKLNLPMRVAIASGNVVVGCVGSGRMVQHTIIGDAVSLAEEMVKISFPVESMVIVSEKVKEEFHPPDVKYEYFQEYSLSDNTIRLYELIYDE